MLVANGNTVFGCLLGCGVCVLNYFGGISALLFVGLGFCVCVDLIVAVVWVFAGFVCFRIAGSLMDFMICILIG